MSLDPQSVVDSISEIVKDVSVFAPAPIGAIAGLLASEAPLIAKVLLARDAGTEADAIVAAIEGAMRGASDLQMHQELG